MWKIMRDKRKKKWEEKNERIQRAGSRIELTKFLDTNVGRNNRSFDRWINSHGWMEIISFMWKLYRSARGRLLMCLCFLLFAYSIACHPLPTRNLYIFYQYINTVIRKERIFYEILWEFSREIVRECIRRVKKKK